MGVMALPNSTSFDLCISGITVAMTVAVVFVAELYVDEDECESEEVRLDPNVGDCAVKVAFSSSTDLRTSACPRHTRCSHIDNGTV